VRLLPQVIQHSLSCSKSVRLTYPPGASVSGPREAFEKRSLDSREADQSSNGAADSAGSAEAMD
jgi:hypothetical protein